MPIPAPPTPLNVPCTFQQLLNWVKRVEHAAPAALLNATILVGPTVIVVQ